MSKYLDEGTLSLYLDQFAVSRIFSASPPPNWINVATLIKQGIDSGKFLYANSVEQRVESTGMDKESASFLEKEAHRYSSGWCFFSEAEISANYIICRIRKIVVQKYLFLHQERPIEKFHTYEKIAQLNETFRQMISEAAGVLNIIRQAAREGKRGDIRSRDFLIEEKRNEYTHEMQKRLFWLSTKAEYTPEPITLAGQTILLWADLICKILVGKHRMTQTEAQSAFWILEKEGLDAVPSLSIRASLEAMMAYRNIIETPNDHIDIMRIASALPFADIMLVDSSKATDVRELKLDKKFQTEIYSGKKKDLENLNKKLTAIIETI